MIITDFNILKYIKKIFKILTKYIFKSQHSTTSKKN